VQAPTVQVCLAPHPLPPCVRPVSAVHLPEMRPWQSCLVEWGQDDINGFK
jgi:hypothetical protein